MAKVTASTHVWARLNERISEKDIPKFLEGVRKGIQKLPGGPTPWAIKVVLGAETIGYAVGNRTEWKTVLSGGQTPDKWSQVVVSKL